jgi:outer membrane lipoprotein-sorting protein
LEEAEMCSPESMWRGVLLLQTVLIFALLVVLGCSSALAGTLTMEDVCGGIESRQSRISDYDLSYTIESVNHDAFYEGRRRELAHVKATTPKERLATMRRDTAGEIELGVPDGKSLVRVDAHGYRVWGQGNKCGFETSDIKDGSAQITGKGVYDGETLKFFSPQLKNGVVERTASNNVLRFPTIGQLLGAQQANLSTFLLKARDSGMTINTEDGSEDGRFVTDVVVRSTHGPYPRVPVTYTTEYRFTIDPQRDFWPTHIQQVLEKREESTGKVTRVPVEDTRVLEFMEVKGIYYPKKIVIEDYETNSRYGEPNVPLTMRTVSVDDVKLNANPPAEVFALTFPNGTSYYDAVLGVGMTVGDSPENLARQMQDSLETSPVSEQSKGEALGGGRGAAPPRQQVELPSGVKAPAAAPASRSIPVAPAMAYGWLWKAAQGLTACLGLAGGYAIMRRRKERS